jgi:hypothetical protein
VYLVQKWTDPRLKNVVNTSTVVTGKDIGLFWIPDTYCVNARQSDLMMTDDQSHSMIKLDKHGRLTYSRGYVERKSALYVQCKSFSAQTRHYHHAPSL